MASGSGKKLTTFRLREDLTTSVKSRAAGKGLTLTAAVEQAMALWLACDGIPDVQSILEHGGTPE